MTRSATSTCTSRALISALLLSALLLWGGAAPARGDDASDHLQIDDEIALGVEIKANAIKEFGGVYNNPEQYQRILALVARILPYSDRAHVTKLRRAYNLTLVNDRSVNAMCSIGGNILVTRGLIEQHRGDIDLMAFVIGHEIAHAARRHSADEIENMVMFQYRHKSRLMRKIGKIYTSRAQSPKQEMEADTCAMIYVTKAGFNPEGALRFFGSSMKDWEQEKPGVLTRVKDWMRDTHPRTQSRITNAQNVIATLRAGKPVPMTPVPIYNGPPILND